MLKTAMLSAVLVTASAEFAQAEPAHPYAGMWVTADNHIRHELLPNGLYIEARGETERAYEGRYVVTGNYIKYWDDTGFVADGIFVEPDVLHHAGMVLRRSARCWLPNVCNMPLESLLD